MQLVADLSRNSPTLATWQRERTDWEFEQAWLLIVTGHWVAVRGRWFVDTWSNGTPVRIADAPRRRKRVRYAYRVYAAPHNDTDPLDHSEPVHGRCAAPEIRQHTLDLDGQRHALRAAFQGLLARGTQ